MATFNKFNSFVEAVAEKKHNLGSDTLKALLTNTQPSASNTVKADITEISSGNGYTAGGITLTVSASSQTSGTYKLVIDDATMTASGGSVGPFQYVVIYNDTAANDELIGWYERASATTIADGDSLTLDFDGSAGVLTIA